MNNKALYLSSIQIFCLHLKQQMGNFFHYVSPVTQMNVLLHNTFYLGEQNIYSVAYISFYLQSWAGRLPVNVQAFGIFSQFLFCYSLTMHESRKKNDFFD